MEDWRRIDIDALNTETTLTVADLKPAAEPIPANQLQAIHQQIAQYQMAGGALEALQLALTHPPYGNTEAEKTAYAQSLLGVLVYNKSVNDIKGLVQQLDQTQQDNLLKYLYKIMGDGLAGQTNSGVILNWFDQLVEVTGVGSVVRYLSDRRTV